MKTISDELYRSLMDLVEVVSDWNLGHEDLCGLMMERANRKCSCGYDDINKALKTLGEVE